MIIELLLRTLINSEGKMPFRNVKSIKVWITRLIIRFNKIGAILNILCLIPWKNGRKHNKIQERANFSALFKLFLI